MRKITYISLLFLASACQTPTKYGPHGESGGYSEKKISEKVMVARFAANAFTSPTDAQNFSLLRAIEICKESGYRVTKAFEQKNQSTSQTVQKTSNYNYQTPTTFNAQSNTYGGANYMGGGYWTGNATTNTNGTIYGGQTYGGSQSWTETYNYPVYDTYFMCQNRVLRVGVQLKDLSAEDMKSQVKDFMGATQVRDVMDKSPNKGKLLVGDIILKIEGVRVQTQIDYGQELEKVKNVEKINLSILREGKPLSVSVSAVDVTSEVEAFETQLLSKACSLSEISVRPICNGRRVPAASTNN